MRQATFHPHENAHAKIKKTTALKVLGQHTQAKNKHTGHRKTNPRPGRRQRHIRARLRPVRTGVCGNRLEKLNMTPHVLDTHAALWNYSARASLGKTAETALAGARHNELIISDVAVTNRAYQPPHRRRMETKTRQRKPAAPARLASGCCFL